MKLHLENIGNFKDAEIEFNGITVIAGKNGTGKTTISKSLYAMFNGLNSMDKRVEGSRIEKIDNIIFRFLREENFSTSRLLTLSEHTASEVVHKYKDIQLPSTEEMSLEIKEILLESAEKCGLLPTSKDKISNIKVEEMNFVEEIKNDVLSIDDELLKTFILRDYINELFYFNVKNQTTEDESRITLEIKNEKNIWSDNLEFVNETTFNNKAIYINSPMIIDELSERRFPTSDIMKNDLLNLLRKNIEYKDDPFYSIKVEKLYERITSIIGGNISTKGRNLTVKMKNNVELDIRNLATGLKTFAVIDQLLRNRALDERDVLLLDEPEVHLHPTMQLKLAELIVILQEVFELTILINTHSLHFVEAIEVYSKKHGIGNKCKFYNAVNKDETNTIEDVSNDLNIIYNELDEALDLVLDGLEG